MDLWTQDHLKPDFLQVKNKGEKRLEDGDDQWYRQRDSELRSLRRSLDRARKTLHSVRDGRFPSPVRLNQNAYNDGEDIHNEG